MDDLVRICTVKKGYELGSGSKARLTDTASLVGGDSLESPGAECMAGVGDMEMQPLASN